MRNLIGNSHYRFSHDAAHIISLFPCLKSNAISVLMHIYMTVYTHYKTINRKKIKLGRAVALKWAEESRIEKWAESSGPRSPRPIWFWAEMTRNTPKPRYTPAIAVGGGAVDANDWCISYTCRDTSTELSVRSSVLHSKITTVSF